MTPDIFEIMTARHSVRQYVDRPIPDGIRSSLDSFAAELNKKGGLNVQIFYDEPECFGGG